MSKIYFINVANKPIDITWNRDTSMIFSKSTYSSTNNPTCKKCRRSHRVVNIFVWFACTFMLLLPIFWEWNRKTFLGNFV